VAFISAGAVMASWASRIPQIRDQLGLSVAQVGLVLLATAGGSVVALPSAGIIVHRFGTRRTVAAAAVVLSVGLSVACLGLISDLVAAPLGFVVSGFLLVGFANGAWDVAMNVHGAHVERRLDRAIMPRFHAGFSVGTVLGALVGSLMVATHTSVAAHLLVVAAACAVVPPFAVRGFLVDPEHAQQPAPSRRSHLQRWKEPRTLLIGVFVLAFAFAEGAGADWTSLALIDGYHVSATLGTLGFATFLTAMTLARWFSPWLLDRYGRIPVLRGCLVLALIGLALFTRSPVVSLALVGAVLWGVGVSLGFPVGMSAASDDPPAAAARTSVVSSIGYCAFLGGPPLIGLLGAHISIRGALLVVTVPLMIAFVVTPALAESRSGP